ncbi:hypothetical protein GCM10023091_39600 [Ravibacter arvi]|uniref:AtpZ/AtpI family protein n=1 Tax=Ravibacter arvi TaxID=2051041 RepID=A0ABP8MBR0_9BACT
MSFEPEKPPGNAYGKYASLAFQMLGTILLFTWGGNKLDEWSGNKIPVWTLVLSLISIGASLYLFIRGARK